MGRVLTVEQVLFRLQSCRGCIDADHIIISPHRPRHFLVCSGFYAHYHLILGKEVLIVGISSVSIVSTELAKQGASLLARANAIYIMVIWLHSAYGHVRTCTMYIHVYTCIIINTVLHMITYVHVHGLYVHVCVCLAFSTCVYIRGRCYCVFGLVCLCYCYLHRSKCTI